MSKVLGNRWLRWSLLGGVLIALGCGIYRLQPPEPMCAIDAGWVIPQCFVGDGRKLATLPMSKDETVYLDPKDATNEETVSYTPSALRVWDTQTGIEIANRFQEGQKLGYFAFSKKGNYFAAEVFKIDVSDKKNPIKKSLLVLADLVSGKTVEFPLQDSAPKSRIIFSSEGNFLARLSEIEGPVPQLICVYEVESGRLVIRREILRLISYRKFPDETLLLSVPAKTGGEAIELWNPRQGKLSATLDATTGTAYPVSNLRYLVAKRSTPKGNAEAKWVIWNLRTHQIEGEFQSEFDETPQHVGHNLVLRCPNGEGHCVELRELPSGRRVSGFPTKGLFTLAYSPDGRHLAMCLDEPKPELVMVETPGMNTLWRIDVSDPEGSDAQIPMHFSRDAGTVFVFQVEPREMNAYDCRTGKLRAKIKLPEPPGGFDVPRTQMTPDRRLLLVSHEHGKLSPENERIWVRMGKWIPWLNWEPDFKNDIVVILDTDTCRKRFRLEGWDTSSALLSDDGRTLVTVHESDEGRLLRCWDVDAWKPLRWAVGVPAGLGTLAVLFVMWRRQRLAMVKKAAAR